MTADWRAQTAAAWPPPAGPDDEWGLKPLGVLSTVRLRAAQLWGNRVWVDDAGDVWCPCCWRSGRLVPVAELGVPGNRHAMSPFAGGYGVRFAPARAGQVADAERTAPAVDDGLGGF